MVACIDLATSFLPVKAAPKLSGTTMPHRSGALLFVFAFMCVSGLRHVCDGCLSGESSFRSLTSCL